MTHALADSPQRKKSLLKQNTIHLTPKLQTKAYTIQEVAGFLDGVMRRKVAADAQYGLDPTRKMTLETFTFQEFVTLGFGDITAGRQLMTDYFDVICKDFQGQRSPGK